MRGATLQYAFDLQALHWSRRLVATRGERLALVEDHVTSGGYGVEYEVQTVTLVELDRDGLDERHSVFEPGAFADAVAELDARAAALDADLVDERTLQRSVDPKTASEDETGVELLRDLRRGHARLQPPPTKEEPT